MARDRKRAKQRQQRRVRQGAAAPGAEPFRRDLPGALEHIGEVDEFDAALVRGARPSSEPAEPDRPTPRDGDALLSESAPVRDEPPADEPSTDKPPTHELVVDERDDELAAAAEAAGAASLPARDRSRAPARPARPGGVGRALAFLRASWAELQRVQWPDRRQVAQATAVVLGFVAIAGAYLGLADYVAQKIVDAIL